MTAPARRPAPPPAPTADTDEQALTPAEVAALFRVQTTTVTQWANTGKLHPFRTPGGTRRYHASEIGKLLDDNRERP